MNGLILSLVTVVLSAAGAQSTDSLPVSKFPRPCGTLNHVDRIAMKGNPEVTQERDRPLDKVVVMLFPRRLDLKCCGGLSPVARVYAGRSGAFDFRLVAPGPYWLVARVGGHDYKMAVDYGAGENLGGRCPDFAYGSGANGELSLTRIVLVQ